MVLCEELYRWPPGAVGEYSLGQRTAETWSTGLPQLSGYVTKSYQVVINARFKEQVSEISYVTCPNRKSAMALLVVFPLNRKSPPLRSS